MSRQFFYRRRAERFAQLLDEADEGRLVGDDELHELVSIGRRMTALEPTVEIDAGFRTDLRAMLIAAAEREGIGATASTAPVSAARTRSVPGRAATAVRRRRTRTAIVLGVAAGAITVSGISAASDNSLPGDALYGMKRSTERAQLALAKSDASRGQLHLDFARTRLVEAQALRGDAAGFAAVLDDMDRETRSGVESLTTSAVKGRDARALNAVESFVADQRGQLMVLLDGIPQSAHERVSASLDLIDRISHRVDSLRRGLACGTPMSRTDALGPLPGKCAAKGR